jgi:hypothetical protein
MLPDRLDRLERPTVEPLDEPLRCSARMRRLHLDALAGEHLQPSGRAVERVTFWHIRRVVRA